ncbi:hypothetical protein KC207_14740 [Phycicoccus sp. BSK3Z-2]|uniref:ABC-2 type transport system permease protein n=1 Tax=Phycicoccus avicenniae TaxID=2828860 RepID=A0A941DA61_9MICO|nr:hypothetical protein [Phycicoccus avicenniae]MBR7744550.1 hypothetical protein [Phycicoccus avicenniae]
MTLLVVRLRLAMWRSAMTRSALHLTSSVLGGLGALAVVAVLGPAIALLVLQPERVVALTVPLFASLTLFWTVLALAAAGVDNVLDPTRFAVLPVRAWPLSRSLLAASFTGIPAVMLVVLALAQTVAWTRGPGTVLAALLAAVLGCLTAVLGSRAATSVLAAVMGGRTGRLLGAVVVSLVTVLPLGLNLVVSRGGLVTDLASFDARGAAVAASWTPVGWAWALPFDVATGRWGPAAAHLVLAVLLVAGLWWVWATRLARVLTSPLTTSGGQRIGRGRLLPVLLGRSPVGTVAARRVRAWYRDSRLVSIALRTAVLPVFFVLQAVVTDLGVFAGIGVVSLGVFAGLTLMNDLAFDGEAWWLHVSTGLRGRDDRLGRVVASVVVFGPVVALTFGVSAVLGLVDPVVPWLTVTVTAFLASLALATLVGAVLPGTAPRVGGNPFAASSGGAAQGCALALLSFVGPAVLVLPVLVPAVLTRGTAGEWVVLVVGVLYGLVLLAGAVVLGGRWLEHRAPEMLGRLAHAQL